MAEEPNPEWKCLNITVRNKQSGAVIEYKIRFYRKINGWYDEIRYDSHEIKRGRKVASPHLHVKLATRFKDPIEGEQELKRIIEIVLPQIGEMTR
jgi:hypothetical protein